MTGSGSKEMPDALNVFIASASFWWSSADKKIASDTSFCTIGYHNVALGRYGIPQKIGIFQILVNMSNLKCTV